MTNHRKLPREFYTRGNTLHVARGLLGQTLVVPAETGERVSGVIVETEAYLGVNDKAAHSYGDRRTRRTESMYGMGGTVYVYFIYGMYYQFNVVTNAAETPHAVLIRAVEPVEGLEMMRLRRRVRDDRQLTSGPGKLCIALGIDRRFDRADLLGDQIWIEEGERVSSRQIAKGARVGVAYAAEDALKPWRFWIKNNPFVSRQ